MIRLWVARYTVLRMQTNCTEYVKIQGENVTRNCLRWLRDLILSYISIILGIDIYSDPVKGWLCISRKQTWSLIATCTTKM